MLARVALAVVALGAAQRAFAQGDPKKPVAPPAPAPAAPAAAPAPARVAPTFDALHVAAAELPEGWSLSKEMRTASPQPATLLEDDLYSQILPKARHQDFQTIVGKSATGSILYFDWGEKIPDAVEEFVPPLLFGGKEKSTKQHPERIERIGGIMLIVSFPFASEEGKWVIERLRQRFGLRVVHDLGAASKAVATLHQQSEKETKEAAQTGLAYADEHAKEIAASSFASFLEGELATTVQDYARAEKAYGRALALDATSDPLIDDGLYWATKDGHGTALWGLKRWDDAARELTEAAKIAAGQRRPEDQGHCLYNVACCLARLGKADEAIATLKQSLALAPKGKDEAAKDDDFASIRARPEFQALVK
jgi:tetratricopeptide (TPR) repeat protein